MLENSTTPPAVLSDAGRSCLLHRSRCELRISPPVAITAPGMEFGIAFRAHPGVARAYFATVLDTRVLFAHVAKHHSWRVGTRENSSHPRGVGLVLLRLGRLRCRCRRTPVLPARRSGREACRQMHKLHRDSPLDIITVIWISWVVALARWPLLRCGWHVQRTVMTHVRHLRGHRRIVNRPTHAALSTL